MMKRIIVLAFFLICVAVSAQVREVSMLNREPKTTVQMNAITVAQGLKNGSEVLNSDTNTIWRYNGTIWEDTGTGGGLQSTDIDTFVELDAIVVDATLAKSGDNVSIFTNDSFVDLTSNQTNITGNKIFNELRILDNGIGSFSNALEVSVPGGLNQSAFPHFIVDEDENEPGSSKINFLIDLGVPTYRVLKATASDLTYNGTSLLSGGGSSPPFDDNSPHIRDNLDNTKTITIVADNISTATNRNLTMPDADVDLGNLGAANLDLTANYTWSGTHTFTTQALFGLSGMRINNATNDYWTQGTVVGQSPGFVFQSYDEAVFNTQYALNFSGSPVNTYDLTPKSYVDGLDHTDDQTASEVNITDSAANYDGTTAEAAFIEVADSLAVKITSDITGVTGGTAIKNMYFQTEAGQDTDGTPPAGVASLCINCSPAEVVATATIAMDGWKMYDDQTADAATITLSDCDPGETLTVYINRASAPTLAGTGLTFNQLPNTTAFASATTMMIIFEVAYDGTTIDYYYVER